MSFHFDFYGASIPLDSFEVLAHFSDQSEKLGIIAQSVARGRNGYQMRHDFLTDDGMCHLNIQYGGVNQGTYVGGSGILAEPVAEIVRAFSPAHKVSRADVCLDLSQEGLFGEIKERALSHARKHNLEPDHRWNPNRPEEGETLYLGSRKSPVFLRIYQKGWEQAKKMGKKVGPEDPHWVRIEPELKPRTRDKAKFSTLSPIEMLGYGRWLRLFADDVLSLNIEPVRRAEQEHRTFLQKAQHGLEQYHRSNMSLGAWLLAVEHGYLNPTNEEMIDSFLAHARKVMLARHPNHGIRFDPGFEALEIIHRAANGREDE